MAVVTAIVFYRSQMTMVIAMVMKKATVMTIAMTIAIATVMITTLKIIFY